MKRDYLEYNGEDYYDDIYPSILMQQSLRLKDLHRPLSICLKIWNSLCNKMEHGTVHGN